MSMEWFVTHAGKCWECGKLAADVNIMYVNAANQRYCSDCRYDSRATRIGLMH